MRNKPRSLASLGMTPPWGCLRSLAMTARSESLPICSSARVRRLRAARSPRTNATWSAGDAGLALPRCRARAAIGADIRRTARTCRWCELLPPYVRAARSVCWAPGDVGLGVVHALKYGGWHRRRRRDGARAWRALDWPIDVVEERRALVPVPLSPTRLRERGYNQSELLAAALATHWSLPVLDDVLARTRHTETQTRLTPGERLRNVSGAFRAPASARHVLRGAHVVLVDDVVTTAATLNACAAALYEGGARIVSFVTFGRAPALGDRC